MAGAYWDTQWNVIEGCTAVSAACTHCWAAQVASRFPAAYPGLASDGKWTGKVTLHPERLALPHHWRKPRRVFVANMGDLFHEDVPDGFIQEVFRAIEASPRHLFMVLTKRSQRLREWTARQCPWPNNACVGITVENQPAADERVADLLATASARKWVSFEPLLGPITIPRTDLQRLSWAAVGCESGHGARPMEEGWVRSLCGRLAEADVPWLYKQAMRTRLDHRPLLDGVRYDALPEMTAPERQLRALQSGDPEMP